MSTPPKQTFLVLLYVQGVLHDYTRQLEFLEAYDWRPLHHGVTLHAGLIHTTLSRAELESMLEESGFPADQRLVLRRDDIDWLGVTQTADKPLQDWLAELPEWREFSRGRS